VVVLSGELTERWGRQTHRFPPLSTFIKPAGVSHANECDLTARSLIVEMRQSDAESLAGEALRDPHFTPPAWPGIQTARLLRLFSHATDEDTLEMELAELLARVLPAPGRPRSKRPSWLDTLIELVRDGGRPPSLRDAARLVGRHPVYVARAFRRHTGLSLGEYVRRLRIVEAAAAVFAGERSVSRIAADVGFADQSHLTRVFRDALGLPPGAARATLGSPVQDTPGRRRHAEVDEAHGSWSDTRARRPLEPAVGMRRRRT
jgi:AraC-like DNA-binding protein